jgi:hypothetical protein
LAEILLSAAAGPIWYFSLEVERRKAARALPKGIWELFGLPRRTSRDRAVAALGRSCGARSAPTLRSDLEPVPDHEDADRDIADETFFGETACQKSIPEYTILYKEPGQGLEARRGAAKGGRHGPT